PDGLGFFLWRSLRALHAGANRVLPGYGSKRTRSTKGTRFYLIRLHDLAHHEIEFTALMRNALLLFETCGILVIHLRPKIENPNFTKDQVPGWKSRQFDSDSGLFLHN
ncbi:hypothetical protein N9980_01430, partial [bacterium]|nr:hypothetical protein [bacterium]